MTDSIAIFRAFVGIISEMILSDSRRKNRAAINEFLFHYAEVREKVMKKISDGAKAAWGSRAREKSIGVLSK